MVATGTAAIMGRLVDSKYMKSLSFYKKCSQCKTLTSLFSPDKRASDGLQSYCKPCKKKYKTIKKSKPQAALHDKTWRLKNPGKKNAHIAKRNAAKLNRTPKWLTKDQNAEITEFYILAKELNWLSESPLEVDHIIPLQGKLVSGLHVPWNLQILPASYNQSKGNR